MKEGIAVLLLFFNKVETTGLVLERILEAKPSVLLLAQDGAREDNAHDEKAVPECRKRVEELLAGIDWPCEIYRNYAEKNMSCDPREYSAISWAFGIVDKLIILEDDCLCSSSFFPFMEELLLRYEKDENRYDLWNGAFWKESLLPRQLLFYTGLFRLWMGYLETLLG